jgi:acyl-ACP thioesterase
MSTTRVAYPRALEARDEAGCVLFQVTSLWVLMDRNTRAMVLPGKSDVEVPGILQGGELASPLGLPAKELPETGHRQVCFTDLDCNGHMNNTRYLDWVYDLLPSEFYREHSLEEMTVCYLAEALEHQMLDLNRGFLEENVFQVDIHREDHRIFSAKMKFRWE